MCVPLQIAIIGCGSVARYVCKRVRKADNVRICGLICRLQSVDKAIDLVDGLCPVFTTLKELPANIDLIVDCAGHKGLIEHGPVALAAGIDVITISTGALADPKVVSILENAADAGKAKLKLLSGAVGCIDALGAGNVGQLFNVTYKGRKPPGSWVGSPAEGKCDLNNLSEPFVHFSGSARDAAVLYPKNANVAATIALTGIGLDQTKVELIADPGIVKNIHEISAIGEFGELSMKIEGEPLSDNPKSSALAAMSLVHEIYNRTKPIGF